MSRSRKEMRKGYHRNRFMVMLVFKILKPFAFPVLHAEMKPYRPKNKTFLVISNHTDALDPGFLMLEFNKYIRFVASDHVTRGGLLGFVIKYLGGVIVKRRSNPPEVLWNDILDTLKADIPVGLFAEGSTSLNGETGFMSANTGKLVKDSGKALITHRFIGGYLRSPRWANTNKIGPVIGEVVNEYSAEELATMTVDEINEIIRRDTYINAFEEQRKSPRTYTGENMAEYLERILYVCPKCRKIGTLHSKGDFFKCDDCGYNVEYGTDAFFHSEDNTVIFDNVLDWDKWQREEWKKKVLAAEDGELIFEEKDQVIRTIKEDAKIPVADHATFQLYKDKFVIIKDDGEKVEMSMPSITRVWIAAKDSLIVVNDEHYYDVSCHDVKRSAIKYVAAWMYLRGKDFV